MRGGLKAIGEWVVGSVARGLVWVLRRLGPVAASNLGGAVARVVGPWLRASRVADVNVRIAMPELDRAGRRRIVLAAWENLGRTAGELPHLGPLQEVEAGAEGEGPCWSVAGMEHIDALVARGGPGILISAHLGNWEMMPASAVRHGLDFGIFYRPADNGAVDRLITGMRQAASIRPLKAYAKGAAGARQALQHLSRKGFLGMLVDQKMNDGVEARFFGRPAMTTSATATLAIRLKCTVLPVYVERLGPARLRVVVEAPMALPDTGDRGGDVLMLTQAINDRVEEWVRARPGTWLWMHRRFGKAVYRR